MIEASQTNSTDPMLISVGRRLQETQFFLKMAAIELRRIADQAPDIAGELYHMARALEAEVDDLSRCNPE